MKNRSWMLRVATGLGVVTLLLPLAACRGTAEPTDTPETLVACYDKGGILVEYDDDCEDDGLYTRPPKPVKTSGGLKTAGPIQPSPRTTRR